MLEDHKAQQETDRKTFGADDEEHNRIFCRPDGAYYFPDQISVRVTSFARKLGPPGVGLHSAIKLSIYSPALPADVNAATELWNTEMADVF